MRRVQLYGTGAATASAVANVTIPAAGKLRGCAFSGAFDSTTDNARAIVEYSKIPTSQIAVNGSQEPFFIAQLFSNVGAAGFDISSMQFWIPLDIDVRQGEIIYLHAAVNNGTYYANAVFYYA